MLNDSSITGLILSGGLSTRMGGLDKGLVGLNQRPMIAHIINKLKKQVGSIVISANHHIEDYSIFGYPVYRDLRNSYEGPIAGIESVSLFIETQYLGIVPCDTPFFPSDLFFKLKQHMISNKLNAAYATVIHNGEKQDHPLCCLVDSSVLPEASKFLARGESKAIKWLEGLGATSVEFGNPFEFMNINKVEDLSTVSSNFKESGSYELR